MLPAILKPEARPLRLRQPPAAVPLVKALLTPHNPSESMVCRPVSPRVGGINNDDPGLVEPAVLPKARGDADCNGG